MPEPNSTMATCEYRSAHGVPTGQISPRRQATAQSVDRQTREVLVSSVCSVTALVGRGASHWHVALDSSVPCREQSRQLAQACDTRIGLYLGVHLRPVGRSHQYGAHPNLLRTGDILHQPVANKDGLRRSYIEEVQRLPIDCLMRLDYPDRRRIDTHRKQVKKTEALEIGVMRFG